MSTQAFKDYTDKRYSILIADDQKFILKFLQKYFQDYFKVEIAKTIEEAIRIIDAKEIAVIISDHQMADGEGVKILEYIVENQPNIRRVLITADRHQQTVVDMMEEQLAHSFAYKPTVKEPLHKLVEEQMEVFIKNS